MVHPVPRDDVPQGVLEVGGGGNGDGLRGMRDRCDSDEDEERGDETLEQPDHGTFSVGCSLLLPMIVARAVTLPRLPWPPTCAGGDIKKKKGIRAPPPGI